MSPGAGGSGVSFSVFTKPWPHKSIDELGEFVAGLGFDGIELPVRPGYPVEPEDAGAELPRAAAKLEDLGVRITSVAGDADEAMIAACAEAGVPAIRICVEIGEPDYCAGVARARRELEALVPVLDRNGVRLGVQNHSGPFVSHAVGLRQLLEPFEPRHVAAVWCPAHNALGGEFPDVAAGVLWPHLFQVKLKNAFWRRKTGPEAEDVLWRPHWTTGRQGLASWPWVAEELRKRRFEGVVCLDAEYDDHGSVDRLVAEDLSFARSLF